MQRNLACMVFTIALLLTGMAPSASTQTTRSDRPAAPQPAKAGPLVTFVELGSVKCIPCRQMQPVMRAIEEKYGEQVAVVFHDVWKDDQRAFAQKYGVKVIPTQVFLDREGKEFFRHEGFFPESEIDKLFQKRGLVARAKG
ncbi:Thioredoxin [uncultured bacterium]|nr:Thioredoxin [uncultured bacterium]